jgi:hypothetical protein
LYVTGNTEANEVWKGDCVGSHDAVPKMTPEQKVWPFDAGSDDVTECFRSLSRTESTLWENFAVRLLSMLLCRKETYLLLLLTFKSSQKADEKQSIVARQEGRQWRTDSPAVIDMFLLSCAYS